MNPMQEQMLARFFKVHRYLEQNLWILEKYPHLVPIREALNERLLIIIKSKQMLDECKNTNPLKEELINLASGYCRKITSFALLEDITELQGMCFTPKELLLLTDQGLLDICQQILARSTTYLSDLEDYGIDNTSLDVLRDLTDRFKSTLNNIEVSNLLIDQNLNELSGIITEHADILELVKEPGING